MRHISLSFDELLEKVDSSNRAIKPFFMNGKLVHTGQIVELNRDVESSSVLLNNKTVSPDSASLSVKGEEL